MSVQPQGLTGNLGGAAAFGFHPGGAVSGSGGGPPPPEAGLAIGPGCRGSTEYAQSAY